MGQPPRLFPAEVLTLKYRQVNMTVQIILIVTGVILMIGSFYVTEKLSQKEISEISELSSVEMKRILEKNMEQAAIRVEDMVDDIIDRSMEIADQALKKETNLKIQTISEYTGTVLESIKKNHSEVMFLYGMLTDKQGELKDAACKLEKLKNQLLSLEEEVAVMVAESAESLRRIQAPAPQPVETEETEPEEDVPTALKEDELPNNNQVILDLYRKGMAVRDIARQLGQGVGEVKLVVELFRGEEG